MSSGITRPFGRLSRSPGYVSDSLLTRSPLCIAAPCDLHVLATPPAFRLSQDQTLQLNFSARDTPAARRGPLPVRGGELAGADAFVPVVILETSSTQTARIKTFSGRLVTAPAPARAGGSVGRPNPATPSLDVAAGLSHPNCKAQTHLSLAYSNKMIKEDHSLACTTRECPSRPLLPPAPPEGAGWLEEPFGSPGTRRYTGTPGHTPSRLIPTIHLSKSFSAVRCV